MKFLQVIVKIVAYLGLLAAVLMIFVGDMEASITMVVGSLFLLWLSSRLAKDTGKSFHSTLIGRGLTAVATKQQSIACYEKTPEEFQRDYDQDYCATVQRKARQITAVAPRPDPILGYQNFPSFTVKGKKASTKRMNTVHIRARDAETAGRYAAAQRGLIEPLEITADPFEPAIGTNEYGIQIPRGACRDDENALICGVLAHDDEPITPGFMEYVTECNIPVSWLSGRNAAADAVLKLLDDKSKAELYGYAVDCALHGKTPGNILKSPRLEKYHDFASAAALDAKTYSSIAGRPGSDIWKPAKNTIAYRFAAKYFS